MLTRPDGMTDDALARVLSESWGLRVASVDYRPVGFGSHHWEVVEAAGDRWFATVDEADDAAFLRLQASLATARDLMEAGCTFVVAPVPTRAGEPVARFDHRYAVALYPYVDGQSFAWSDYSTPAHRHGVLELIIALHSTPIDVAPHAVADDFAIPLRDELESTVADDFASADTGPYSRRMSALLMAHAQQIRQQLARYDNLVAEVRGGPGSAVVTHGEPHPGNTMLTPDGLVLIDWGMVLLALPERDLCSLDPGDGSVFRAYAAATGTTPMPSALDLYRIRWDLADIAAYVSWFRKPHTGSPDDEKSWDDLRSLIARLADQR